MPCGVETTRRMIDYMKSCGHPVTIAEFSDRLGISHSAARAGLNNIRDVGVTISVTPFRVPRRMGRPIEGYSIDPDVVSAVYWGPNFHRASSAS